MSTFLSATDATSDEVDHHAWELVHAAQAGDMDAYAQLWLRYADVVFRFLVFRCGDRDLAEDLTSETFTRALRRINSISYQGRDVGAWFVTIARNLMLDELKCSRTKLEVASAVMLDATDVEDPERDAMNNNLSELLAAAIAQLGDLQREVITLRFVEDKSVAETSAAIGRGNGATKALQHRACVRMRKLLDESVRNYLT